MNGNLHNSARYKLLALDMDGTVLDDEGRMSSYTCEWLRKAEAAGVVVMFATGRGVARILPAMEQVGLTGPIVAVNGAEVWESTTQLRYRRVLKVEQVRQLRALALQEQIRHWAYTSSGLLRGDDWEAHAQSGSDEWLKFGMRTTTLQQATRLRQCLSGWSGITLTSSLPEQLEVNAKGVNKAVGVHEVCRMLGISISEVAAAGDGENDLELLQTAGLGAAMGNATEKVKHHADVVLATNEEHGVVQLIRDYILSVD